MLVTLLEKKFSSIQLIGYVTFELPPFIPPGSQNLKVILENSVKEGMLLNEMPIIAKAINMPMIRPLYLKRITYIEVTDDFFMVFEDST